MGTARHLALLSSTTALAMAAFAGGCASYRRDEGLVMLARQGQFGVARERAQATLVNKPDDRSFMLSRAKLLSLQIADGVVEAAEPTADRMYDRLRTQGQNANNGFGTFFLGEGNARVYRGEPFEQAYAFSHIAALDGMNGDWGNVRAVANNALFQIRDFSKAIEARRSSKGANAKNKDVDDRQAIIAAAAEADKARGRDPKKSNFEGLEEVSQFVASDFELGYALKTIASRQLGKPAEVDESASLLNKVNPGLGELAQTLRAGSYNAVFVVDFGVGPEKYAYGMDNAYSAWRALSPSGNQPLRVSTGGVVSTWPVVTDVNRLATDLRWNNLEDLRVTKSIVGTGLMIAGGSLAVASRDSTTQLVGLGLLVGGALMKASSAADVRHNELLPQRTYVSVVTLTEAVNTVELSVEGVPSTRLVLAGIPRPANGAVMLRYVRLPDQAAPWATSGSVMFSNDETTTAAETSRNFPYILGGRCVRSPNEDTLSSYQRSGFLEGFTLNDLLDLYKEEGIRVAGLSVGAEVGRHILEGGDWLYTPLAGTVGFARLYGVDRPAYVPRSARVAAIAAAMKRGERPKPR